jgi:peptide/nickel transport system substrate-binding protein
MWDGDCATWQNWYGLLQEATGIGEIMNGTGPYKFVSWDRATQTVTLEAFDGYWRTEPLWEGAHTGVAAIKNILIKGVDEWGTRLSMFEAGDVDWVLVPRANIAQMDPLVGERADFDAITETFGELTPSENPSGPARLWYGVPALSRTDILMNQNIRVDESGSPLMGSGTLGSRGIPADFFQNVHVRKAFNYCFDTDTLIKDYYLGEAATVPYVLSLPGELGADPTSPRYDFDLAKCQEEFTAAVFGETNIWDSGFYFVASYNSGNVARKTMLEILGSTLNTLNPKFTMDVIAMPWASELRFYQAGKLPFFVIGWQEDIHDPHNWYSPYLLGTYGANTFPEADFIMFKDLVNAGVAATDPAARETIYKELNAKVFDYAPFVIGPLAVGRVYFQRWVTGYYNNPLYGLFYYYELGKN